MNKRLAVNLLDQGEFFQKNALLSRQGLLLMSVVLISLFMGFQGTAFADPKDEQDQAGISMTPAKKENFEIPQPPPNCSYEKQITAVPDFFNVTNSDPGAGTFEGECKGVGEGDVRIEAVETTGDHRCPQKSDMQPVSIRIKCNMPESCDPTSADTNQCMGGVCVALSDGNGYCELVICAPGSEDDPARKECENKNLADPCHIEGDLKWEEETTDPVTGEKKKIIHKQESGVCALAACVKPSTPPILLCVIGGGNGGGGCGNGIVDEGEECDDGISGSLCSGCEKATCAMMGLVESENDCDQTGCWKTAKDIKLKTGGTLAGCKLCAPKTDIPCPTDYPLEDEPKCSQGMSTANLRIGKCCPDSSYSALDGSMTECNPMPDMCYKDLCPDGIKDADMIGCIDGIHYTQGTEVDCTSCKYESVPGESCDPEDCAAMGYKECADCSECSKEIPNTSGCCECAEAEIDQNCCPLDASNPQGFPEGTGASQCDGKCYEKTGCQMTCPSGYSMTGTGNTLVQMRDCCRCPQGIADATGCNEECTGPEAGPDSKEEPYTSSNGGACTGGQDNATISSCTYQCKKVDCGS